MTTTSLTCFLGELLKYMNDSRDSPFVEIRIVDDNAQLTPENRIMNTRSFATNTSEASCHLNNRWCSQPSLVTSTMSQSSYSQSESSREKNCTGTCTTDDHTTSQRNASWDKVPLSHDVFLVDDHPEMSNKLRTRDDVSLSNPLMLNHDCEKRRLSSESVHAPRLPQRSSSPGTLQSRVLEKRKLSDRRSRTALRAALGIMAPTPSSLVERKGLIGTKKEYVQSTRGRTTLVARDKKDVVGSQQRQGTTKRI